ncbi:MAG: MFS transporter [Streptosporangiaceae bacterium]|nr:MFS transporter [Streptosporangiaceae bacterium]MBV9853829.1 MFS transporter [Streptosporangiaceae bacterium]
MTSERQPRLRALGPGPDPARPPAVARPPEAGRHRRERERRASYHEVFAVREFRWLWAAQVLSNVGDQFAQVAIAILVYRRTGSAFLTALVYALTYLPPIAGGPLLSGLADLFPRRRVMILCDLIRMGTVGVMAIPGVPLPVLCVLLFGTVLLGAPFGSARSALLPDVLTGDQLTVGTAIGNITHQASQILGFVAGAAVVATLDPYRTLGIDSVSFGISALVALAAVKARPAPPREPGKRPSMWSVSADGIRTVFGSPVLRNLLLFGWLAGFYIVPEGLAAPYAHSLHGTALTVGLLMAAMPLGTVAGALLFGRLVTPSEQIRSMGWLAMASCAPLIGSAWNPPLGVVLALWVLAGVGGAFQLAAVSAFARSLEPGNRARAFGVAQSGLYAVQGVGILAGGAAAETIGAPMAVSLAGLLGLCAATGLAMSWSQLRGKVIADQRGQQ